LLAKSDIQAAVDYHYRLQHMNRMEQACLWIVAPEIYVETGNEKIAGHQENREDRGYPVGQINQMALLGAIRDFGQEVVQAGRQKQDQQIAELDQEHRQARRVNLE